MQKEDGDVNGSDDKSEYEVDELIWLWHFIWLFIIYINYLKIYIYITL